eukprot:gene18104-21563_t
MLFEYLEELPFFQRPGAYLVEFSTVVLTWLLLHTIVPHLATNIIQDSTLSEVHKGIGRCLLSIFPLVDHENLHLGKMTSKRSRDRRTAVIAFQESARHIAERFKQQRESRKWWSALPYWLRSHHFIPELVISGLVPFAMDSNFTRVSQFGNGEAMQLLLSSRSLLFILLAYRVIAPLSSAVRELLDEFVENSHDVSGVSSAAKVAEFLPPFATGLLWVLWALFAAHVMGINISNVVQSMGLTGIAFALALQNYAADIVVKFPVSLLLYG